MLYMLYMLYKQSKIFKSKCSVDSVACAGRGGGGVGGWDGARPVHGPPRLRLGVPGRVLVKACGRVWPRCKGKACSPRKGERRRFRKGKRPHFISLLGGEAQDRVRLALSETLSAASPASPTRFPLLLPRVETLRAPPSVTCLSLTVRERRFPAGRCPAVAETGSEHLAPPTRFHANPVQRHQPPSPARFTTATSCDFPT